MYNNIADFCKQYSKVYIFGNGEAGKSVAAFLHYLHIPFSGHIISENYLKDENGKDPVYYISEIEADKIRGGGIIIGCSTEFYNEVINDLIARGFESLCFLNDVFYIGAALRKLAKKGVDLSKDVLDMKKFRTANLFPYAIEDSRALFTYSCEFPDLGYHYLGEKNCFDEGPYEFEDVVFDAEDKEVWEETAKNVRLHPDDVVFDCGANIGMFSALAAAKGCKVFAFEPAPAQMKYLEMNRDLYPEFITIVKKAVADYNGTAQFNLCPAYNGGDSLVNKFNKGQTVDVDVITLDEFKIQEGIEKVNFIKADLEGAERMLLKGAARILKEDQPILSLCTYHRADDIQALTNIIKAINPSYKITYGWKKMYAWVD